MMMQQPMMGQSRLVKLTQANGKALLVSPDVLKVVETLTEEEVRKLEGHGDFEGSACGVWLDTNGNGALLSAVLKDKFGWLVRQASAQTPFIELRGLKGKRLAIGSHSIRGAQETQGQGKTEEGDVFIDYTLVHTHLQNAANQAITLASADGVSDILEKLEDFQPMPEDPNSPDPLD